MSLKIVTHNAERQLISWLQNHADTNNWGAFHFRCSRLQVRPDEEDLFLTIQTVVENKIAFMYLFRDGDVVIVWNGHVDETFKQLMDRFYERYAPARNEKLERFYQLASNRDDLRALCEYKESVSYSSDAQTSSYRPPQGVTQTSEIIDKPQAGVYVDFSNDSPDYIRHLAQKYAHKISNFPAVRDSYRRTFKTADEGRIFRKGLSILIVEDQAFSRQLLLNVLERLCNVHVAVDAETAVEIYAQQAPNIVLIDIDLPGINGHQLVSMLRSMDTKAYTVMVTANNYLEDVECARANGVKGFIVKPYTKSKILQAVERYIEYFKANPFQERA